MLQRDLEWTRLTTAICADDRLDATAYNLCAAPEHRLRLPLGPVPCVGAVTTAPVVLLASHPPCTCGLAACGASFAASGWPLSALHPEAPSPAADWWHSRLEPLVERFGAQHVANAVAAIFLSPWHSERFDPSLRLASRKRVLDLAAGAAGRDAMLVVTSQPQLWTEHPAIASLPATRLVPSRSRRRTHLTPDNIGAAWDSLCQRIEVHAWL